jgi:hypothetical protein
MKKYIYFLFSLLLAVGISASCDSDDFEDSLQDIQAPSNVDLVFQITQDNTGLVTITPNAQGATTFEVFFGDGSEDSEQLSVGESTQRNYDEGTYPVRVVATGLNGLTTESTRDLTVSFRAPENLVIEVTNDPSSNLSINVTATADFATSFEVDFGEDSTATPQTFMAGETVNYTYSSTGEYTVTVTAFSGGAATTTASETVIITDPIELPITFESETLDYQFLDFGGAASAKEDNPQPSGINTSSQVARFLKTTGAETFAGTTIELDSPIDFSTFQKIRFKSLSPLPSGATVKLKLENATDANIAVEVDAFTTVTDEWETLLFDFSGADLTQQYSKVIVFYDFGNTGNGDTFYFDDIELTDQNPVLIELPLTFENNNLEYMFTEFNGAPTSVVANPDPQGINTSANVANTFKANGAAFFAGAFIDLESPINFDGQNQIKVKTYSPKAGAVVRLKIENLDDNTVFTEVDAVTTVANEWEELSFDFSTASTSDMLARIVIFFDFGEDGDGSNYYFDDIRTSDGGTVLRLPLTFDDPSASYMFENFGGAGTGVAANPDPSGINTTQNVAQTNKSSGAEVFAGSVIELNEPFAFATLKNISLNTYVPDVGITVKLKLENADDTNINIEVDAISTVANSWEELVYDFSAADPTIEYSRIVVFFDFGNVGQGKDYYYDQVQLTN